MFDDLSQEMLTGSNLHFSEQLSTVYAHHFNFLFCHILHHLFNKDLRQLSLNTHYFLIPDYKRDKSQIMNLARQMFPQKSPIFMKVYDDAIKSSKNVGELKYGYCLVCCHPQCDDLRIFTCILPSQAPIIAYEIL